MHQTLPTKAEQHRQFRTDWHALRSDLWRNALFLFILWIGFINDLWLLTGYNNYLWILLIPFLLFAGAIRVSARTILILAFSLAYTIPVALIQHDINPARLLFTAIYPLTFYCTGIYLCKRCRYHMSILWIALLSAIAYGAWAIVTNVWDAIESGQIVNVMRIINDGKGDGPVATHINMMVCLVIAGTGMIFIHARTLIQRRFKMIAWVIGLVGLFASLHLLNRTAIVLAFVACVIGMFWEGFSMKRLLATLFILGAAIFIFVNTTETGQMAMQLAEGFTSREDTGYSAASAGGRVERWTAAIDQIMQTPLGSEELRIGGQHTFAHNLWLDTGIWAGWPALILLVVITILWFIPFWKFIRSREYPRFATGYVAMTMICLILQMGVEPVWGQLPLLLLFFLNWGFLSYDYGLNDPRPVIIYEEPEEEIDEQEATDRKESV